MRIAVLGPLEVTVDGSSRPVPGGRLRALLTRLAVAAGRTVPAGELIEAIWGDAPPGEAANALQALVSRLRRTLDRAEVIVAEPGGYRLAVSADAIDAQVFSRLVEDAQQHVRGAELTAARQAAADALSRWRGDPLPDAGDAPYAVGEITSLESRRLDAIGIKIESDLQQGEAAKVAGELERLVAEHPLRETFAGQLIRALAGAGRTGEALAAYERCRGYLADELGTDPGPALQQLHLRLLRGELESPPREVPDTTLPPGPVLRQAQDTGKAQDASTRSGPSTARKRDNLARGLTSFVGRDAELDQLSTSINQARLTTLIGTGGAGKTRTATEAALRWLDSGGPAAWMVELAPILNAENIPGAILGVIGDRDPSLGERTERVRTDEMRQVLDLLTDAECLLIFDNCEHLVDGAAKIVSEILAAAPGVHVLATSREPLSLAGETLCELPPLEVPPPGCAPDRAQDYAAVRLWLDRAHTIKAGFTLTDDNVAPVLEIVRRLDGIPLAIELAVARLHALPVDEIARLLTDRFRLLTTGHRGSLPRHRTLAAVVGWSWDLLSTAEQLLAERLSVFPAGAGIEAATAVCSDDRLSSTDIPQLLVSLTDKSLLQSSAGSPVRFTMLETIREYGQQRLADHGELDDARTAHADHFYDLALWLEPAVRDHRQNDALDTWNQERGNVLAGLTWLIDSGRGHEALTMLLSQLWGYLVRDQESEVSSLLTRVIAVNAGRDEPLLPYAEAARLIADLQGVSDWNQVTAQLRRVQDRVTAAPEPPFPSLAMLRRIPDLALSMNFADSPDAIDLETVTHVIGEPTDPWVRGMGYLMAAAFCENNGRLDLLSACIDRAHADLGPTGDQWNLSRLLGQRARILQLTGDTAGAIDALNESVRLSGTPLVGGSVVTHLRLIELYLRLDDYPAAREQLDQVERARGKADPGRELGLIIDTVTANVDAAEGHLDRALHQSADLRTQIANDDLRNMFAAHAGSSVLSSTAGIELDAGRATTDRQMQKHHRDAAAADLARAYPAARLTLDLPIIGQLATVVAQLAEANGQPAAAAYLLGAGARLLGADDWSDLRRGALAERLRPQLGEAVFAEQYAAGKSLDRDTAIASCDPARIATGTVTSPG